MSDFEDSFVMHSLKIIQEDQRITKGQVRNVLERFGRLDDRLEHVEDRLIRMEGKISGVENRFDALDRRFDFISDRFAALEDMMLKGFTELKELITYQNIRNVERFERIEKHIDLPQFAEEATPYDPES